MDVQSDGRSQTSKDRQTLKIALNNYISLVSCATWSIIKVDSFDQRLLSVYLSTDCTDCLHLKGHITLVGTANRIFRLLIIMSAKSGFYQSDLSDHFIKKYFIT